MAPLSKMRVVCFVARMREPVRGHIVFRDAEDWSIILLARQAHVIAVAGAKVEDVQRVVGLAFCINLLAQVRADSVAESHGGPRHRSRAGRCSRAHGAC